MIIVMFVLFLNIYKIFAHQEQCQNFDFEKGGKGQGVEEQDLCRSTKNERIHIGEYFSEF